MNGPRQNRRPIPEDSVDLSNGTSPNNSAKKFDQDKPSLANISMIPMEVLNEVGEVFKFGAAKYGTNNWRIGFSWLRVSSAVLRHIFAWLRGESNDPESGYNHLSHAIAGLIFLIHYENTETGTDDRWKE